MNELFGNEHPIVQYATEQQILSGIWFSDSNNWGWWDTSIGYYFVSNRYVIPMIIVGSLGFMYMMMFGFWGFYQLIWCLSWEGNNGNSKWSICQAPQPDTLTGTAR